MADRRSAHLVCYDIRENRRLRRVHRILQGWGLRMQYSVFQCLLSHRERFRLTEVLRRVIDERVDDLRIYTLQPGCTIHYQGSVPVPSGLIVEGLDLEPIDSCPPSAPE